MSACMANSVIVWLLIMQICSIIVTLMPKYSLFGRVLYVFHVTHRITLCEFCGNWIFVCNLIIIGISHDVAVIDKDDVQQDALKFGGHIIIILAHLFELLNVIMRGACWCVLPYEDKEETELSETWSLIWIAIQRSLTTSFVTYLMLWWLLVGWLMFCC